MAMSLVVVLAVLCVLGLVIVGGGAIIVFALLDERKAHPSGDR